MKMTGRNIGLTLVELLIVMLMSAILMTGMLLAFTQGIDYWRSASQKNVLYNEGSTVLSMMSGYIHNADFISIKSVAGHRNAKIELKYPEMIGRSAAFYFDPVHKTFKYNDQTENRNKFNVTLLPMVHFRGGGPDDEPYLYVDSVTFTPLDDIGQDSPQLVGYYLIKTDLYLSDNRDNTLHLSSVFTRKN